MITEKDLLEAIAYYQGERNPDANTCIKLASCLTILDYMNRTSSGYSGSNAPESIISYKGDSKFANAVSFKSSGDVWPIIDELMSTLQLIQPQLYDTVMKKIQDV